MEIYVHRGDLPDLANVEMAGLAKATELAVDTETQGLYVPKHRLCLVQLSAGDGVCHLVQLARGDYNKAKNLKILLADPKKIKIFHYARFDMAALHHWLGIDVTPVFCTKIASRLVRTYGASHSLAGLVQELLGIELLKAQQSSDWAKDHLSEAQKLYAANDVFFLHRLKKILGQMLERESKLELAEDCFSFLPTRVKMDLEGYGEDDIFAH